MYRKTLLLFVLAGLLATIALGASALFTSQATVTGNTFTTGSVIISTSPTSIEFYSPSRTTPVFIRDIKYYISGNSLMRQETDSTNTNGPPWTFAAVGPVQKLFGSIQNPTAVFQYCITEPTSATADMRVDTSTTASSDKNLITWLCTAATTADTVKTVVIRVQISAPSATGVTYTYGSVATLRFNAAT